MQFMTFFFFLCMKYGKNCILPGMNGGLDNFMKMACYAYCLMFNQIIYYE